MNRKKIFSIILIIVSILAIATIVFYFTKRDENTLTVTERNWIENNKNNLIDLSIPSGMPVLSDNGSGVVFDFLSDLEKDTGLDFNKLSYESKPESDYAIVQKNDVEKKDILLYQDNYVLVTKNKKKYNSTNDIKNIVIGVLEKDAKIIPKYLSKDTSIIYKNYSTSVDLLKDLNASKIDAIVLPRLQYLDKIVSNKQLNIAYNISEYKINYVIHMGDTSTLNNILTKYFKKWNDKSLKKVFDKNLVKTYFKEANIKEQKQVSFHSKDYNYGFVENAPFDVTTSTGMKGFNHKILNDFAKATNVEIKYKKYSNNKNLVKDFNANNLDIIFNDYANQNYKMDVFKTLSTYNEQIAIVSKGTSIPVNNIYSLKKYKILAVKNSKIEQYLKQNDIETRTYNTSKDVIKHMKSDSIAALDYYTYDYYARTNLKNYPLLNTINLDDNYSFIARDIQANEIFNQLLNFYISFYDLNPIYVDSYQNLLEYNQSNKIVKSLLVIFSIVLFILVFLLIEKIIKRAKDRNKNLSKTDKLRYIDAMTSVKNRNFLNDNIESWDNSKVYPQTVIIIDLNNIAYINDNFGHSEGDKVIVEAASVLISNQLSNSEIIRTNGNEFLIFIVGHDEKAIISYIRKLHKEFKQLTHGFGAAIGYSMITDEIKTVDDAVNEATLDMRNKKKDK